MTEQDYKDLDAYQASVEGCMAVDVHTLLAIAETLASSPVSYLKPHRDAIQEAHNKLTQAWMKIRNAEPMRMV